MIELKEFIDELGLGELSDQVFKILSTENFEVYTLLSTPKQDLQLIFNHLKIANGIQAKIFAGIQKRKVMVEFFMWQ